ncbi:MAG TPA: hypothetical protein VND94_05930 [Terriglobia bacterium]|nr:hypothetical protein [Terriglobia bacterium]
MKIKEKPFRRVGPEDEERRSRPRHATRQGPAGETGKDTAERGEDLKQGAGARAEAAEAKDD